MDKPNFHGYLILQFYPTCEIHKNNIVYSMSLSAMFFGTRKFSSAKRVKQTVWSNSSTYAGPVTVCCTSTVVLNTVRSRRATWMSPLQYGSRVVSDAAIRFDDRSTWRVNLSDRHDSYSAHYTDKNK